MSRTPASTTAAACLGYLELLTKGAPAQAYEHPVPHDDADADDLSPDGPDPDGPDPDGPNSHDPGAEAEAEAEAAGVERGRRLALRIRAELEGRRRREAELTALFETVHDLAGLRDLDDVLQAIVQRARRLLGTEVAYMTLTDTERGDTYMRVTVGSVSARFQQLRLGMGEGLGGLVAQTARPYVTEDYPRDARFQHTDSIDTGVGEEGLVAILGVPLLLGGRDVIGVLYAADRRERVFEREQIALLRSFAAHAAVAIDNARLLTETTQALAGLREAHATSRRASEVHDRLTELVLRGGGVDDVTRALAEVLGGRVEFTDTPDAALAPAVERSRREGHAVREGGVEGGTWVAAVSAGGELLGALLLRGHAALAPVDQRTLERAAMVTSLLQLARRSAGEAEQRVRGELLNDLLDAAPRDPRLLRERAARVNADLDAPHTVLTARLDAPSESTSPGGRAAPDAARFPVAPDAARIPAAPDAAAGADRQRLWAAASHLAATRHGLAAGRDGGTVLLLPVTGHPDAASRPSGATVTEEISRTARQVAAELGRAVGGPVTVGASAPVPPPAAHPGAVAAAYPQARRCLDALVLLGRQGEGAAAEDLGFLGLLLTDTRDVAGFVRRTLGPALDYDARRGTELVATMDAYFSCAMSPVRAKDVLHVHVNTVAQRLDRVARLLGEDWQAPHRALEIQLALRLHRLSGALGT
ncbi:MULTISPECIES: GAF domain-containing protein [unclassified Streptomyces]|uniref:helix-turn-helix domain-containing protein n=1 Tax=unclassified Streptomyces TaxID=2593676 RepID=UPI002E0F33AE|nr:GAF domain-containing protein [Streptomyces sp. NBC_01186]WSS42264.1 GAF domain-containing protein [Streptomyces sp. NBC_01187]